MNWQAIDFLKLDRQQCEKIKTSPITCADGPQKQACQIVKTGAEGICSAILSQPSYLDWIPESVRKAFNDNIAIVLVALIGFLGTAVVSWLEKRKYAVRATQAQHDSDAKSETIAAKNAEIRSKSDLIVANESKIKSLEERVVDPFFELPTEAEQYATNMILIGEGGSGKTTIVHALSASDKVRPDVATAEITSYTIVKETTIDNEKSGLSRRLTRIYTEDYVGQDWTQGIWGNGNLARRQKIIPSTTLVIVVDLVQPVPKGSPVVSVSSPEKSRIKHQLKIYYENSIQTLLKLLGPDGQIILFINKIDLINSPLEQKLEEAREAYKPLIAALANLRGVKFHLIIGSAVTGTGIVGFADGVRDKRSLLEVVCDHAQHVDVGRLRAASR